MHQILPYAMFTSDDSLLKNLSSFVYCIMNFFEKVPFSASLGISNSRGISRFRNKEIRLTLVDPSGAKMAVGCHVVIALKREINCGKLLTIYTKQKMPLLPSKGGRLIGEFLTV